MEFYCDMPQLCQESQGVPVIPSQAGLDAKMTQDLLSGCVLTARENVLNSTQPGIWSWSCATEPQSLPALSYACSLFS